MHNPKAISEAVRAVLEAVQGADAQEMIGKRPKKVEVEMQMGGDGGPEHESEEMALIQALEGLHGGEEAEEDNKDGPPLVPGSGAISGKRRY